MKKCMALFLSLLLVLSLTACGGGAQGAAESGDARNAEAPANDAQAPDDADTDAEVEAPDDADTESEVEAPDEVDTESDADAARIANPFEDYDAYADAEAAVGFAFHAPEEIGGYDSARYRVAKDAGLFEIVYANDAADLTARKAPGGWDISGDYNEYQVEEIETVQGVDVTCWGSEDLLFLAMWTMDDYSYSLSTSASMEREDFMGYVETLITLNAA